MAAWICSMDQVAWASRVAWTFRRDVRGRASRPSRRARGTRRICSTACRRSGIARPVWSGAILQSEEIAAELICDGYHVHPALVRTAVAAKGPSRIMAITDGTAVSGLPAGARALLGGQPITAGESAAFLGDGTLAGSALTMDRAFRTLVGTMKLSLVDAATVCSTTAARELGLAGHGVLARDAIADLVVLDDKLSVVQTYVAGQLVYSRTGTADGRDLPTSLRIPAFRRDRLQTVPTYSRSA